MKILVTLLIFFAGIHSLAAGDIPGDIREYYDRANFVASFSTPSERNVLVRELQKNHREPGQLKGRASKIFKYMQLNAQLVSLYDSVSGEEKKLPTLEQRYTMGYTNSSSITIHKWIKVRSGWKKDVADVILLNQ